MRKDLKELLAEVESLETTYIETVVDHNGEPEEREYMYTAEQFKEEVVEVINKKIKE